MRKDVRNDIKIKVGKGWERTVSGGFDGSFGQVG
jgi:hypothetical protein